MKNHDGVSHRQTALHQNQTYNPKPGQAYEGKVIAIHPEDSSVDIRLYDGQLLRRVRVLLNSANTIAGFRYLSSITEENEQQTSQGTIDKGQLSHIQDTLATILYVQGSTLAPRVIGFSFPQDAQMHVNEEGLSIFRHESGVYELIDQQGHHETHYPDGSYLIIAQDTSPKTVLVGPKAQEWNPKSGAQPVNFMFKHSTGSSITITPDGTVTIQGKTTSQSW